MAASSNTEPVPGGELSANQPAVWLGLSLRRAVWACVLVAWAVALVVPVPVQPTGPPMWGEPIFTLSKSLHIGVYAVLAAVAPWLGWAARWRWVVVLGLVGHGMLTEFLQFLLADFSHRTGQWSDVGLDAGGILIGTLLTWSCWRSPVTPT